MLFQIVQVKTLVDERLVVGEERIDDREVCGMGGSQ